jgi:hypothetical protein
MIDLKKELNALKKKASSLMKIGNVQEYIQTLCEINSIQLKLVGVRYK